MLQGNWRMYRQLDNSTPNIRKNKKMANNSNNSNNSNDKFLNVLKLAIANFGNVEKQADVMESLAELETMPDTLKKKYFMVCAEEAIKTAEVTRRNLLVCALYLYPTLTDKQYTELVGGTESGNRSDTPVLRNMLKLFGVKTEEKTEEKTSK